MPGIKVLKNKVAGHSKFLDIGKYLLKGLDVREYRFYRKMDKCPNEFKKIFPKFYGVMRLVDINKNEFEKIDMDSFDEVAEKHRLEKKNEMDGYFLCIQNFSNGMKYPCSMDVKLGCRWSYMGVSEKRGRKYDARWDKTTSAKVGLRYCGHIGFSNALNDFVQELPHVDISEVPESSPVMYKIFQNKDAGWEMKIENLEDTLAQFFYYPNLQFRFDLVEQTIKDIKKIIKPLEEQKTFTFRSTSLLLTYDALGNDGVKMALIDFSHEFEVTPDMVDEDEGLVPGDEDIVQSLRNFVKILKHKVKIERRKME